MGLFQQNQQTTNHSYTLNTRKTMLIIGLGNIGEQYELTRHNIGFACLDELRLNHSEFSPWREKSSLSAILSDGLLGQTKIILVKPTTFMNESGRSVRAVIDFYKIKPTQIIVVHDELDIPFGQIRTRLGGSSAGHNGIKSITNHIGDNYGRVKIGIAPSEDSLRHAQNTSDYVLSKFSAGEQSNLPHLKREVQSILVEAIYSGQLNADTRSFIP